MYASTSFYGRTGCGGRPSGWHDIVTCQRLVILFVTCLWYAHVTDEYDNDDNNDDDDGGRFAAGRGRERRLLQAQSVQTEVVFVCLASVVSVYTHQ